MTAINAVVDLALDGDVAVITVDSPPVNALSTAVRMGLHDAFTQAIANPAAIAIVLFCAGRTFIAGADISEFGTAAKATGPGLLDVQAVMESSPKPVVAAIHGTALGGGLEVALCAHYRVAVPSSRCGLPEVNLGLLPGAGGTQRLPRIVGARKALELMTTGEHMPAADCFATGLVDELVGESSLLTDAIAFARRIVAAGGTLRKVSDRSTDPMTADEFAAFRKANAKKFRGFKAPEAIVQCVEASVALPFTEGMKVEQRLFGGLVTSSESAAQRYVFFAEREVWKIPDLPAGTATIPIASVGVIGAGTMGGGIAMNFVNVGLPVTIVETSQEALDRGLKVVRGNYERSARNGRFTMDEVDKRMALITPATSLDDLGAADLVVEAVFERMDVKKDVFARLDAICKPGAILATNTSMLNIDEIASATARPESVIGLHFFSPANVMKLIEVVRAEHTSPDVISTSMQLAKRMGKMGALVRVCFGFVGNRMLAQRTRESQALLLEGALPWEVDKALVDFGFAMGPFQMSDLAGLDIGWVRAESRGEDLRDRLCELDRRGQKNGAGYYDYDNDRNAAPSPVVEAIVREVAEQTGKPQRSFTADEIVERLILPMINEGAKILDEGMAMRASDIDIIWINGYNWPAYRGGPMWWADHLGLAHVLDRLRAFEADLGPHWNPSPLLERLVAEGGTFQS
jgi:3-hydroxyacyl-CoA dehydrogenase